MADRNGLSRTTEYEIWRSMKKRCESTKANNFPRYGGRGIYVCDRWRESFQVFLSDMGPRPSTQHSIDRENNDGPYEPGNCRWATRQEQRLNRRYARTNRLIEWGGVTKTATEWARVLGINNQTLFERLKHAWSLERIFATRGICKAPRPLTWNGKTMVVTEWARELGVPNQTLFKRLKAGWPIDRVLGQPIRKMRPSHTTPPTTTAPQNPTFAITVLS